MYRSQALTENRCYLKQFTLFFLLLCKELGSSGCHKSPGENLEEFIVKQITQYVTELYPLHLVLAKNVLH